MIRPLFVFYGAVQQRGNLAMHPPAGHVVVLGHRYFRMAEVVGADPRRQARVINHHRHRLTERIGSHIVVALVDRNERRRTQRTRAWRRDGAQSRARQDAYQRFVTARQRAAASERSRTKNDGYERELWTSSE